MSNAAIDIVIYHNPECGTSRNTLAMIRNAGIEPHVIEYLKTPPNRPRLVSLIARMGISARQLLREKGTPFAELGLADPTLSDDQLIDAMIEHPILINRPIVVSPLGVKLCRPSEEVLDLLPSAQRGAFTKEDGEQVIDAAGKLVIPGGVDPHTHLELPFGGTVTSDTFETGTRAAAFGGTTCIIDFAVQSKGTSTIEALDTWHAKAAGKTAIDYGFHMIITDMPDERMPEMRRLADEGVTSYKLFMAYPGALLSDDGTIFRTMRKAGEDGTLVCMHAENGLVIDELIKTALAEGHIEPKYHALTRPTRLEAEGTHRALAIAEVARAPIYVVHLSSYDALQELRAAQARGVMAHAETCPQYLLLDVDAYDQPGFEGAKYVLTPPLRDR